MSYDLAVWDGPPPLSNAHAASECARLVNLATQDPPTPAILSFVDCLIAAHPDRTGPDDGDGPWGSKPLLEQATGPLIYFGVKPEQVDELVELVEVTATDLSLVAYDPQLAQLVPSATSVERSADFELPAADDLPLHLGAVMGEALTAGQPLAGVLEQVETGFYVQWLASGGRLVIEAQGEQRLPPGLQLSTDGCHQMQNLGFVSSEPNWRLEWPDGATNLDQASRILSHVLTAVRNLPVGTAMALQTFPV